jgi:hypothetical protein
VAARLIGGCSGWLRSLETSCQRRPYQILGLRRYRSRGDPFRPQPVSETGPELRDIPKEAIQELRELSRHLLGLNDGIFAKLVRNLKDPALWFAAAGKIQISMYLLYQVRGWLWEHQPEIMTEALPRWRYENCGHPIGAREA